MEEPIKTNQKFEVVFTQVVKENKEIKSKLTRLNSTLFVKEQGSSQPQAIQSGQYIV